MEEETKSGIIVSETKGDGRGNDLHFSDDKSSGGHGGEFAPKGAGNTNSVKERNQKILEARERIRQALARQKEVNKAPTMSNFFLHRKEWIPTRAREWRITQTQYDNSKAMAPIMKQVIANSNITVRVPWYNEEYDTYPFLSILENGDFKNQFETHTTKGADARSIRFNGSRKMFGHTLTDMDLGKDLEKYGCLQSKNVSSFFKDYNGASQYGEFSFIMKRKNLFDRTTYCIGDSGPGKSILPQKLGADFDIFACADGDDYCNSFNNKDSIQNHFERNLQTPSDLAMGMAYSGYVECQLHGKVTLEDVKSIVVRSTKSSFVSEHQSHLLDILKRCKEFGIKLMVRKDDRTGLEEINLDDSGNIYYTNYESEEISDD